MSNSIARLKERVVAAEEETRLLRSMLESFWTGNVPSGATLDHMILAKWGRKRLDEKAKTPVLLAQKQG